MSDAAVLEEFRAAGAFLEGHFILTSGRHSGAYMQCARVMTDPRRGERLVGALAGKLGSLAVDLVVAPAMGGIIVGYELARQIGSSSIFAEREGGRFTFRRGFLIEEGARVLVAEDVVTTGLSVGECAACARQRGGIVVAVACLVDRSGGKAALDVPLISLLELDLPTYPADDLPPELAAIPATKPGSRGLA